MIKPAGGQPLPSTSQVGLTTRSRITGTHTWRRIWSRRASTRRRTGRGPTSSPRCRSWSRSPTSASSWASCRGTTPPPRPPGCSKPRRPRQRSSDSTCTCRRCSSLRRRPPRLAPDQAASAAPPPPCRAATWSRWARDCLARRRCRPRPCRRCRRRPCRRCLRRCRPRPCPRCLLRASLAMVAKAHSSLDNCLTSKCMAARCSTSRPPSSTTPTTTKITPQALARGRSSMAPRRRRRRRCCRKALFRRSPTTPPSPTSVMSTAPQAAMATSLNSLSCLTPYSTSWWETMYLLLPLFSWPLHELSSGLNCLC